MSMIVVGRVTFMFVFTLTDSVVNQQLLIHSFCKYVAYCTDGDAADQGLTDSATSDDDPDLAHADKTKLSDFLPEATAEFSQTNVSLSLKLTSRIM
jgi:hypothetical protein